MWKFTLTLTYILCTLGCGYKVVNWSSGTFQTITIPSVRGENQAADMKLRLRDALLERCLAGASLKPVDNSGHLILATELLDYAEQVIATDVDGRTRRLQFNMRVSFKLTDTKGNVIWSLLNYQYSDQYSITTTAAAYRDEAVFVQDDAMRSIADLVVTNITLAVDEWERKNE